MGVNYREALRNKKKIVIKIGTSSITYPETGNINLEKLEKFVRILINMINQGKDVIVVSSGAVGVGRQALGIKERPKEESVRQACAAVGQARLMMIYEKLFAEYGHITAQILLTKESISGTCAEHAKATFNQLAEMKVIPIVNENDSISVDELLHGNIGDNDTLSAYVARLVGADLLILLSDIDGLYTDDPKKNPQARFIHTVKIIDENLESMGKGAGSDVGTGGMSTKINAAKIVTEAGCDMMIANGDNIYIINDIMQGKKIGTLFLADGGDGANEMAPERSLYRRQQKREKKMKKQEGKANE